MSSQDHPIFRSCLESNSNWMVPCLDVSDTVIMQMQSLIKMKDLSSWVNRDKVEMSTGILNFRCIDSFNQGTFLRVNWCRRWSNWFLRLSNAVVQTVEIEVERFCLYLQIGFRILCFDLRLFCKIVYYASLDSEIDFSRWHFGWLEQHFHSYCKMLSTG